MAQILDLKKTKPIKNERYLIDTNVWYWTTYAASKGGTLPQPQQPSQYQIQNYPNFLEDLIRNGSVLCHTALSLTELANVIERTEFELYKHQTNNQHLEKKEFRKLAAERTKVLKEIQSAWDTVNSMSDCIDSTINQACIDKSGAVMSEAPVDPYDAIYLKTMAAEKIDYLVSDDVDFTHIKKLILITANPKGIPKGH